MTFHRLPFESVFADESGGNIKTQQGEYLAEGEFPIVDQGKALIGGYTDHRERLCGQGRPALVFGDHTRCIKYIDFPFCMGADGVKVLRPRIEADLKYLYYFLRSLDIPSAGYDRHYKYLKRTEIILPPLPEQRRIAAILDQADALKAKRREALAHLDSLTQSIFIEMFGDPSRAVGHGTGLVLADVVAPGRIVTYGIVQAGPDVADGVPYIKTSDIKNGLILEQQLARTSPEIASAYARSALKSGDIVMSIRATVGTTASVPPSLEGANLTQGTARISPGAQVQTGYLLSFLQTEAVQSWIQSQVKGATFREITLGRLRQLPVLLPPMDEQQTFANCITAVESLKTTHRAALAELDALFASLQHRAFAGQLS